MLMLENPEHSKMEGIGGIGGQIGRPVVMVGQRIHAFFPGHRIQEIIFSGGGLSR